MKTYLCRGFRPVNAESMHDAANIFASRAARKKYGSRAYCRTLNCNGYAQDGSYSEYSAFIGYRTGPHETTGSNEIFTVFLK